MIQHHFQKRGERGERGQAVLIAVIFFVVGGTMVLAAISGPVLRQHARISNWEISRQSFFAGEASIEEVGYRVMHGLSVSSAESLSLLGAEVATTIEDTAEGKQITATGDTKNMIRKNRAVLTAGSGASFHYGIQTHLAVNVNNGAAIHGNVYSNGAVYVGNNAHIYGDVVSAGEEGFFSGHATGTVYAHTINSAQIDRDAHYQTISGSTVSGTSYPGSSDQPTVPLPDLTASIEEWETSALSGGTISSPCPDGTYTINADASLGPIKINCDLRITKSGGSNTTVTLLGNVWVSGNIRIENNVTVRIDPSLGTNSVALIADDPSDRLTGSAINILNNITLLGTGQGSSAIVLVSRNEGGEDWTAINYNNNGGDNDVVFYAPGAVVNLNNNASISAITAYLANINNNTEVIYKSGLASLLFSSGPGGGYEIESWREVE